MCAGAIEEHSIFNVEAHSTWRLLGRGGDPVEEGATPAESILLGRCGQRMYPVEEGAGLDRRLDGAHVAGKHLLCRRGGCGRFTPSGGLRELAGGGAPAACAYLRVASSFEGAAARGTRHRPRVARSPYAAAQRRRCRTPPGRRPCRLASLHAWGAEISGAANASERASICRDRCTHTKQ